MAKTSLQSKGKTGSASSSTEPSTSTSAGTSDAQEQGGIFQAEAVIGKKMVKGKPFYRVKWQGYPKSQSTWEPLGNLVGCEAFIEKYEGAGSSKTDKKRKSKSKPKGSGKKAKSSSGKNTAKSESLRAEYESHDEEEDEEIDEEESEVTESTSVDNSQDTTKIGLVMPVGNSEANPKSGEGAKDAALDKSVVSNDKTDKSVDPKGFVSAVEVPMENVQSQPGNSATAGSGGDSQRVSGFLGVTPNSNSLGSLNWEQMVDVPQDADTVQKVVNELKKHGVASFKVVGLMTNPKTFATCVAIHCVKPEEDLNWVKVVPVQTVKEVYPELLRTYYDIVTKSNETVAAANL